MTVNRRDKGNRFEREVARRLSEWWGAEFRRTPLSGGWSSKAPGDLVTPADFPFGVECKNQERWSWNAWLAGKTTLLDDWMKQAADGCGPGKLPLLIVTRNRCPYWAILTPRGAAFVDERTGFHEWLVRTPTVRAMLLDHLTSLDPEALRMRLEGGT